MATTPSEHDNNYSGDPLGNDALQDYMSSMFAGVESSDDEGLGSEIIDSEVLDSEVLGGKVLGAEELVSKDACDAVSELAVPETVVDSSDTPPAEYVIEEAQHEEWENRTSPSIVENTAAKSLEPPVALPSFEPAPAKQSRVIQRLMVEQVPSDIPLSQEQKKGLQKLLDQKLLIAPAVFTEQQNTPDILALEEVSDAVDSAPAMIEENLLETEVVEGLIGQEPLPEVEPINDNVDGPQTQPQVVFNYREHWNNQLPDWGQETFEALLFSSRGVTLAIPLIALGHIYLQTKPLNQLPSLPSWVIGVKPLMQGQLKVIDAGAFFMPERPNRLNTDADLHLLALADSQWAFAVDSVANPISISACDVQWRPLSDANPWLAGAIKQHMCVLIDTPALLKLLAR